MMIQKMVESIRNPKRVALFLLRKFSSCFSDELYLKILFRLKMGYPLNLQSPQTFNEKLQWLKLYNRKPEYTKMVDKYAVKEYVAKLIGEEYIIPTLGVWDRVEDIDFDSLPNQFVLKTTHGGGGGGVVVCKNKFELDFVAAKQKLQQSMRSNIYRTFREWPYKNVPRRIIAEQYMVDESGVELKDYKFFCFNGEPKCFKVDFDRQVDHKANYYDPDWNLLPFGEEECPPNPLKQLVQPPNFEKMLQLASCLSKDIPFVRLDFYNINGAIYFGEITFFPAAGMGRFEPEEWDLKLGKLIELNN